MYLDMSHFIVNITSSVNQDGVHAIDYYEEYKVAEKDRFATYKWVEYSVGILVVLSNILVVISSGLILKKGRQPRNTYLLLGNVSLADTIVGIAIIYSISTDKPLTLNLSCIFEMGMLLCPSMVSVFSVGLIAVDRYIYILHGLYYQRWFNTKRLRIGILCIWIISITLAFIPATGWSNTEFVRSRCYYEVLYPGAVILLVSALCFIPVLAVTILYSFILVQVFKTINNIKSGVKIDSTDKTTQLRVCRGKASDKNFATYSNQSPTVNYKNKINRSVALNASYNHEDLKTTREIVSVKANSRDDDFNDGSNKGRNCEENEKYQEINKSNISVYTIESNYSGENSSTSDITKNTNDVESNVNKRSKRIRKVPNKWRALSIVMLTTGSIIFTWMPFFIAATLFVFCEEKITNKKCMYIRSLLGGPLATLGFFNSILNPMIYAWWHKGFQKYFRTYYRNFLQKICICSKSEI